MGVVENMKDVADLVKKFNDIDLNRRIVTLEGEVMDLTRDKRRAEDRIEELERALKFKGELKFKNGFYWAEGDDGPYCVGCWDSKKAANRVVTITVHNMGRQMQCPVCRHNYGHPR
jgi:hypothetical protein